MLLASRGCRFESRELANLRPIRTHTDVQMAGLAVGEECGHREVAWSVKQAAAAADPELWTPVIRNLIEDIGTSAAYEAGVVLVTRLIEVESVINRRSSDQKTLPPIG